MSAWCCTAAAKHTACTPSFAPCMCGIIWPVSDHWFEREREKISAMVFWKKQCRTQEVCEGTAGPIKWSSVRSKDGDIYLNSQIFRLESHG